MTIINKVSYDTIKKNKRLVDVIADDEHVEEQVD